MAKKKIKPFVSTQLGGLWWFIKGTAVFALLWFCFGCGSGKPGTAKVTPQSVEQSDWDEISRHMASKGATEIEEVTFILNGKSCIARAWYGVEWDGSIVVVLFGDNGQGQLLTVPITAHAKNLETADCKGSTLTHNVTTLSGGGESQKGHLCVPGRGKADYSNGK